MLSISNIKLLQSERLTDAPDGGGSMTAIEVPNGVINNLFPDISRLDRVTGRVSMRKAFLAVSSDNADTFYGSHVILTKPPADAQVELTMFTTKDWEDVRSDAQFRLENYLAAGGAYPGTLYGTQFTGSRAITIVQQPSNAVPDVGSTLVLVESITNVVQYTQYVRIIKVSSVLTQFEDGKGTFNMAVLTVELSDGLLHDFHGIVQVERPIPTPQAVVLNTVVADAATYYGVKPLAAAVAAGVNKVKVSSVYAALVPSTQSEQPILDISAAPNQQHPPGR